jgi:serine/threonine protein kinase
MTLTAGTRIGGYEIVALIGAGGMGEVYRARDTRLNRDVAMKVLPEAFTRDGDRLARFKHEAQVLASLNHPHIAAIHDVGPNYLVLEYVEGKSLQSGLSIEEALRLAIQIASAIEEAHSQGILHRDLKPGNIIVNLKGTAKLLDFGLAKLMMVDADATRTMDGAVLGTAAYMSPEQAQAHTLDERSDIFSFGAVLYEMLSGRRVFAAESTAALLIAVLRDDPPPLSAPASLERVVRRCLHKQPGLRYQTMAEVRKELEEIAREVTASPARQQQPSIAVLPFANMSADKDNEYFSDGLAEEVINALTHIPGLKVIARTSAFAFKGKEDDIRRIAEALGVANILEGSVRKAGNRIRVTAQLITASDGSHLWSQRYDRELADVFAVQDEIAQSIAQALQMQFAGTPQTRRRHTPTLAAYEAFLKARHQLDQLTAESLARGHAYLEQAIRLDPDYALAHNYLGEYYFSLAALMPAHQTMPQA